VARKLQQAAGVKVVAYVTDLGGISAEIASSDLMQLRAQAEANAVRCPDAAAAERMLARLEAVRWKATAWAEPWSSLPRACLRAWASRSSTS
jgi:chorismate synthase